jgi:Tfp pilus assembly PilM family ATPase
MVVDFHEVGPLAAGGTKVMVAAVPKIGIRNQLASLSTQKIDPERVDLDTMALWRAADWTGAFQDDDDDDAEKKPVHVVIDLGVRSVKVLLTEGDHLIEMRVLRLGDATVADQIARLHGLSIEQARTAIGDALRTGADVRVHAEESDADVPDADVPDADVPDADVPDAEELAATSDEDGEGDGEETATVSSELPATTSMQVVAYSDVDAAHTKFLQRLARELTRFLAATGLAVRIRSVWMTGEASQRPGISEMLEAVFGVRPQELDVLDNLSHDLDDDEAAALSPMLAVAVGHALGRMGGPVGFELRQEDLALTGGFDRIKFPLAIACMVGLLTLFVFANQKSMRLKTLELELGQRHNDPKNPKAVTFHGQLNTLFQGKWFQDKNYFVERKGKRVLYAFEHLVKELTAAPVHRRVRIIRDRLRKVAKAKQKESGVYEDISLESGLAVLVRWAEVMKSIEPELGRYLVPNLDLDMRSGKLVFTAAFRGDEFRSRKATVESAFKREWGKPDSPFVEPKQQTTAPEIPFRDIAEKGISGAYFTFTIPIRESFAPFGPSSRLGALIREGKLAQPVSDYLAAAMNAASGKEETR